MNVLARTFNTVRKFQAYGLGLSLDTRLRVQGLRTPETNSDVQSNPEP